MIKKLPFFGSELDSYNTMFFLGLLSVIFFYLILKNRFSYKKGRALFYALFTLAFGFLSAWLTAIIENSMLLAASGGEYDHFESLRNYGIPMFLPVFWLIYCLLCREPFKKLTDYLAPSVYSVMTFVKIGCTLGGCCYGERDEHGIWNADLGYKTFPVQIYDALSSFVIVIICLILIKKLSDKRPGYVYPIGGMLFAATKGFWENFRVHSTVWEKNYLDTGMTFWQFWMIILFVCCFIWLLLTYVRDKKGKPDFDKDESIKLPHIDTYKIGAKISGRRVKTITHRKKKK
ncbi:MAG: prolipoprotein diacylglyceryl transferase [Clostridia bacterium]|nr:prolipoprotein diacylglyceryl transferase [Clostridia bacterium]